ERLALGVGQLVLRQRERQRVGLVLRRLREGHGSLLLTRVNCASAPAPRLASRSPPRAGPVRQGARGPPLPRRTASPAARRSRGAAPPTRTARRRRPTI